MCEKSMKFCILIQILMRSHVIDMAAQGHCFLPYTGLMNLQIWVYFKTDAFFMSLAYDGWEI